jgi:hypothetical protein
MSKIIDKNVGVFFYDFFHLQCCIYIATFHDNNICFLVADFDETEQYKHERGMMLMLHIDECLFFTAYQNCRV